MRIKIGNLYPAGSGKISMKYTDQASDQPAEYTFDFANHTDLSRFGLICRMADKINLSDTDELNGSIVDLPDDLFDPVWTIASHYKALILELAKNYRHGSKL
jgi:hypothetical protein